MNLRCWVIHREKQLTTSQDNLIHSHGFNYYLYAAAAAAAAAKSLQSQRRQWQPTPVILPGKSHGWRSLIGCSPRVARVDTTERLHFHFSLSCIGEGNDNPLQRSCLENPRDGGAWWAAVYGVAESDTTEVT